MNLVLHFTKTSGKTTLASAKIARFIAENWAGSRLVDSAEKASEVENVIRSHGGTHKVIVVNSPWAFCDFRPEAERIFQQCAERVYVQNDFAISIPKQVRNYTKIWSTCDNQNEQDYCYVNWNQLLHQPVQHFGGSGLVYWGAYRKEREELFKYYFPALRDQLTISASSKAAKKFHEIAPEALIVPPFEDVPSSLAHYDATLYIQDKSSDVEFHSPANRFYEALGAGVAIFFDQPTVKTFAKAGIYVEEFKVSGPQELSAAVKSHRETANKQAALWGALNSRLILQTQLKELLQTL